MHITLRIWRQSGPQQPGRWMTYSLPEVSPQWSLLETLDQLNEALIKRGQEPVAFESDCREGICGSCGILVNGIPHGQAGLTTCQVYMRQFRTGQTLTLEPFPGFPVVRDLVVDRSAFDRIMAQGGYISVNVGSAPRPHDPDSGLDSGTSVSGGNLHRLWRLCGGLSQSVGSAVCWGKNYPSQPFAPGSTGGGAAGAADDSPNGRGGFWALFQPR